MGDFRVRFQGDRLLVLGFGSIAATLLPLILKHIDVARDKILIASDDARHADLRNALGLKHQHLKLTPESLSDRLSALVGRGDCIVNLTGGVSARDLVHYCLNNGIDYIDTSNERWEHGAIYNDSADFAAQWNLMISDQDHLPKEATALVSHGANPGIVSHFAKQAVEDLAREEGLLNGAAFDWPALAQALQIEALHISEHDTQFADRPHQSGEFLNTWSIEGMIEEGHSAPCFAWGSHETEVGNLSLRTDRSYGVAALPGRAFDCRINSWLPSEGEFTASIIPHEETLSIAELFTSGTGAERYQPSVVFAYRPCDHALAAMADPYCEPGDAVPEILSTEIVDGADELGVLVLRAGRDDVYWYGSTLDIHEARRLIPHANATTLQVAAGVLGGLVWVLENRGRGLVSAEQTDHHRVLEIARPYLGELIGKRGIWSRKSAGWTTVKLLVSGSRETDKAEKPGLIEVNRTAAPM